MQKSVTHVMEKAVFGCRRRVLQSPVRTRTIFATPSSIKLLVSICSSRARHGTNTLTTVILVLPIKRGCLTQTEATTCTGDSCVACNIGDLCNEISSPKHQCVVCSSLVEANCLANPTALTAVQCPAPSNVDLTAAQCYSRVVSVHRGLYVLL